jgi:hypothetical protein
VSYILLNKEDLHLDSTTYEFEDYLHGQTNITFLLIDLASGEGPRLHSHPYEEIFIRKAQRPTRLAMRRLRYTPDKS